MTSHITVSGELGSGKTEIAKRLAAARGLAFVSTGELQRSIAESSGLSTLETNYRAELDEHIDATVDELTIDRGKATESCVFDSRMAWHFVPGAFKVHLLVDPHVGARRLHSARRSSVEGYDSPSAALEASDARFGSERSRFAAKYHVDIARLRNYDLVVDTTEASIEAVFAEVSAAVDRGRTGNPRLMVDPRRVIPTEDMVLAVARYEKGSRDDQDALRVSVGYSRPFFFALDDHLMLHAAIQRRQPLIEAFLKAEGDEEVVGGLTADEYLKCEPRPSWIYDWEEIHGFRFEAYPDFERS